MMNCRQATAIISRSLEQKLTYSEQLGLKFHLLLCSRCRCFRQNNYKLSQLVKDYCHRTEKI